MSSTSGWHEASSRPGNSTLNSIVLRQKGLDALHVGEIGMAPAADEAIIEYARANGYSIVTLDADFHSLLALAKAFSGQQFSRGTGCFV